MLQEVAELGGFTTMTMEEIQEVNGGCSMTVVGVGVFEASGAEITKYSDGTYGIYIPGNTSWGEEYISGEQLYKDADFYYVPDTSASVNKC